MESMRNFEASDVGLLLPGVTVKTGEATPSSARPTTSCSTSSPLRTRNHFVLVGDVTDVEGQTADFTPRT